MTNGSRQPMVFVNIPCVKAYELSELALWVTLRAHALRPVITKVAETGPPFPSGQGLATSDGTVSPWARLGNPGPPV